MIQEGVEILLVASCYGKRDFRSNLNGPLGSNSDFMLYMYVYTFLSFFQFVLKLVAWLCFKDVYE